MTNLPEEVRKAYETVAFCYATGGCPACRANLKAALKKAGMSDDNK